MHSLASLSLRNRVEADAERATRAIRFSLLPCDSGRPISFAGVRSMARSQKTRRCYCLLPEDATREDAHGAAFRCGVGGHAHLNFAELYGTADFARGSAEIQRLGAKYKGERGMLERGEVEWLAFPRVLRLRREPEKRPVQRVQLNDLSARVGPFLAAAVRRSPAGTWPHVLLAEVQGRRMAPSDDRTLP